MRGLSLAWVVGLLGFGMVGVAWAAEDLKLNLTDFKMLNTAGEEQADLLGYNGCEQKLFFYIQGSANVTVKFPKAGNYTLVFEASCDKAKEELAKIKIKLGEEVIKPEFALTTDGIKEYKIDVKAAAGDAKLKIEFLNDTYKEGEYDLNFYLHAVKFVPKS